MPPTAASLDRVAGNIIRQVYYVYHVPFPLHVPFPRVPFPPSLPASVSSRGLLGLVLRFGFLRAN